MGATKAELLEQAKLLSSEERLDLVFELWDTITGSIDPAPVPEELRAELRRRLADDEANPARCEDWFITRMRILNAEF